MLTGIRTAVVGGDIRQVEILSRMIREGAEVGVIGLSLDMPVHGVKEFGTLGEVFAWADAVIAPLPALREDGVFYTDPQFHLELTDTDLVRVNPGALFFCGSIAQPLEKELLASGFKVISLTRIDEVAILNSIPSAEGAIQIAMQETSITIHGSTSLVLGFGRTGQTLARMLFAIGSHVTVIARNPAARARAYEMGYHTDDFNELTVRVKTADYIFNTVPALVVDAPVLQSCNPEVFILDLASRPGGIDFAEAKRLGIKAKLAPGLPGLVAPKSSGRLIANIIVELIGENLNLRG